MKTILKTMQKKNSEISEKVLPIFEKIVKTYYAPNSGSNEGDDEFIKAIAENLTEAERFWLWEQHGGCKGTTQDKERKAFALKTADIPLAERLDLFARTFGKKAVLNDDNTITVTFACNHGYYKHAPKGNFHFSAPIEIYFERCAGGRMYELEKALGIKLKIKSVDVSPLNENIVHPVLFTYEVME